ncbi:hypothetical protein ACFLWA_02015 [Chloroflexota bacterium]
MNKGYAFGFILVILVLVLGFYVAYTGFTSTRETLRVVSTPPRETEVGQATRSPTLALSTAVAEAPASATLPSPLPGMTATLTAAAVVEGSEAPPATEAPPAAAQSATSAPAATPESIPTSPPAQTSATPPDVIQPPTPLPVPAYQFRVGGPPSPDPAYPNCCYIVGTVRDAAGNGLEGIQVQASNEWTPPVFAVSKGGPDLGKYDVPINTDIQDWYIVLTDPAGNQMSSEVRIRFDSEVAKGYRLDWRRTY